MWSESWWQWTLAPVTRQKRENGATDTKYPPPNQVLVACLLLSCRTQAKVVLFCLQGEPRTGKVKLKCSQRLMIPGKQALPLNKGLPHTSALLWLGTAMSRKGPRVQGGLDPRPCSSRGKTSCTRGDLREGSRHWGWGVGGIVRHILGQPAFSLLSSPRERRDSFVLSHAPCHDMLSCQSPKRNGAG